MSGPPVLRIEPSAWMREPGVAGIVTALGTEQARFVGGAVRDALLDRAITDIDVATPLPPEVVMRRMEQAGIKTIPTGLSHGTVTALVPGRAVEITTLRRDVETDGRHARVALIDDWDADARRRDFTFNALYLDSAGIVYDPVGGLADLRAGRVRFIGSAETRLTEDLLRALRFYRFFAHYGKGEPDREARAACAKLAPSLTRLSAERVQGELLKLLGAPNPVPALQAMAADGILGTILPEASRFDRVARLIAIEPEPDPLRRLAALVTSDKAGVGALAERLKLSNQHRGRLEALTAPAWPIDLAGGEQRQRRALYHLGRDIYRDLVLLSGDKARAPKLLAKAETMTIPIFPLKGGDVAALSVPTGREIGDLLAEVKAWWEEEDYPDRDACLAELQNLIAARRP